MDLNHTQRTELFESACRQRGLPLTSQRRRVFQIMLESPDHPTADQIYARVRESLQDIARTTVYRILDTFVELGLVVRICHPGSAARYDPKIHQHHHLVCTRCEAIIDIEEARLNRFPLPDVSAHGFEIHDYHIHYRGLCARCHREAKKAAGTRPESKQKRKPR